MNHLNRLIIDLALILGSAGITTLIFRKLKQPIVLGYILAGLLVGPGFSIFPTVIDVNNIKTWADIGIIFLLFSLGLEFSFRKLIKVGGSSAVTGIYEVAMMLFFGYVTGRLIGWSLIDSIFLGGIIAISSTTIIIRTFDELKVKSKKFTGQVFGVLIIEDLTAVLLLVLLSTVAISRQFSGMEMLVSLLKLSFFLILWFVTGIYIVHTFLRKIQKLVNDETLLILSLGLCLIMVVLANQAGFSSALGAFIMGSILAETVQSERIEHLIKSVKDLFGAIFFVSIGMLIDPALLAKYIIPVIILTFVVIIGKTVNVTIGSLISGQPLKQSLQTGMSLSQIGEFSFIIATLGLDLKVTSNFLYPIAVGVSVLTTFITPYMVRLSEPFYYWLEKRLPQKWLLFLNRYSSGTQKIKTSGSWKLLLQQYLKTIIINLVIIVGILLIVSNYINPIVIEQFTDTTVSSSISLVISILLIAPFLWALALQKVDRISFSKLWLDKKLNRGPLVMLEALRVLLVLMIISFLLAKVFSAQVAFFIALLVVILFIIIFSKKLKSFYNRIERRFMSNLNASQNLQNNNGKAGSDLIPWEGHIVYYDISPEVQCIGHTLLQLGWREKFGINVALIQRGERTILAPTQKEVIYPYDHIGVIGTDEQLEAFSPAVEVTNHHEPEHNNEKIVLQPIVIPLQSPVTGKSIRNSAIRQHTKGLVVGIERNGLRILNPDSGFTFEAGDVAWIVGDKELVRTYIKQ